MNVKKQGPDEVEDLHFPALFCIASVLQHHRHIVITIQRTIFFFRHNLIKTVEVWNG